MTGHAVSTDADNTLFSDPRWRELAECLQLTPRQLEIAKGICSGRSYKSIAAHVGITVNTVRMHVRALYVKLDAHERLCAVLRIIQLERELRSAQSSVTPGVRSAPRSHVPDV